MIIYGVFEASNYYEYKALIINSLSLMLPLCIYFFLFKVLINSFYFL